MADIKSKARFSVSSWSLHRLLGDPAIYGPDISEVPSHGYDKGAITMLELPETIASFGIHSLEITHFHLPSRDKAYLDELKHALATAKVELFSLLIDSGDITDPGEGQRHQQWIADWFAVASLLGSRCARVIAGKQEPGAENLKLSITRLKDLADRAEDMGIRLMTENWFALASSPEIVTQLIEALEGRLGLCLDFGNWQKPDKYAQFAKIAAYAESCHAKGFFYNGVLDEEDYLSCLEITQKAGFAGPYTLIYDSDKPTEWEGLKQEMKLLEPFLSQS